MGVRKREKRLRLVKCGERRKTEVLGRKNDALFNVVDFPKKRMKDRMSDMHSQIDEDVERAKKKKRERKEQKF